MNGIFISLDGIDGAGKTTQLTFIKEWLAKHEIDAVFTREPGGTAVGEKLREILLDTGTNISLETETLLMFAARQQHIQEVIMPNLQQGKWVISDRFTDATFAYQGGGRGLSIGKIKILEQWVQHDLHPDLTIILDVPLEVSLARLGKTRVKDRFELEPSSFFTQVRDIYLQRAAANPQSYVVLNTNRRMGVVQQELATILENFSQKYRTQ